MSEKLKKFADLQIIGGSAGTLAISGSAGILAIGGSAGTLTIGGSAGTLAISGLRPKGGGASRLSTSHFIGRQLDEHRVQRPGLATRRRCLSTPLSQEWNGEWISSPTPRARNVATVLEHTTRTRVEWRRDVESNAPSSQRGDGA